ncbi:MAG: undecaprenyl-diphosphate phosphatase [Euryarchaeota archaeon]|nr:undecaprenyl-diphosphate phosphatase [Euryarchaeota archaeon]
MDILDVVILAAIQGVTEWLPVSSSGHLVLAQAWLGLAPPVVFDVVLHLGTLGVILAVFWDDIKGILAAVLRGGFHTPEGRLAIFITLGSIPTALVGFFFNDFLESLYNEPVVVGWALLATGTLLFLTRGVETEGEVTLTKSIVIGTVQGIAIIPGISRSGSTIACGILMGIERERAARFSFLLSIPAVVGAGVMEAGSLRGAGFDPLSLLLGVAVAMGVGYVSLRFLLRTVTSGSFYLFSLYCWAAGGLVLAASLW